jgi:DNA-binding transcriptional ArsR family regulator
MPEKNFIVDFLLLKKCEEFTKPFGCACILQPFGCTLFIETMKRDIFQAIADPTRRAIIALIALQAMTPNAIAEHFDTTRQAVSKHLRILTECELVRREQKGREIYYSLEIEKMKEIDKWLDQYRKIWETRFEQLGEVLKVMKKKKSE